MGYLEPMNETQNTSPRDGLTRRHFLRMVVSGGVMLAGSSVLVACGSSTSNQGSNSTPNTSGQTGEPTNTPSSGTSPTSGATTANPASGATASTGGTVAAQPTSMTGTPATSAQPIKATPAKPVDVTLKVENSFIYAMPTKKQQQADPNAKAQAEVLQAWLDLNPGVKFQKITFDIWTPQTIQTALAGGTEPAVYSADAMGGYNLAGVKSAFLKGWAADVTELYPRYNLLNSIASYVKSALMPYKTDGKWYLYPWFYEVGTGFYYRRDWIKQKGLKEPEAGWNHDDLRNLAKGLTDGKRKGYAAQGPTLKYTLGDYGWDWLTQIPAPDTGWHWKYDYTSMASEWKQVVDQYRAMIYKDKSVLSDITFSDDQVINAFMRGEAAMMSNNAGFYTESPGSPEGMATLAEKLGKPLEEVVGWVPGPVSYPGVQVTNNPYNSSAAFSPDISSTAVDKAFSLIYWLSLGPGPAMQAKVAYEAKHNLKYVYGNPLPLGGETKYKGIPGSVEDAWGKKFVQTITEFANRPHVPDMAEYLPAEKNNGPTTTAIDDATSKWTFESGNPDIDGTLKKLESTMNTQAASFTSSTSKEVFMDGIKKYYQARNDFWKKTAPDFYNSTYKGWYEKNIAPVLG